VKKVVLEGSTDDKFGGIGVDGADTGEGDVVGWVDEGRKGEVCSGEEEKRVYEYIGSIEDARVSWEGKDEDGEGSVRLFPFVSIMFLFVFISNRRRRRREEIESKEMEEIETGQD
jgi:hypothetical protein